MSNLVVYDLNDRVQINATMEKFGRMPEWTPAMGALLIAGILPMVGCTEIPDEGICLSDPTLSADAHSFYLARRALRHWHDSYADDVDENGMSISTEPAKPSPHEFLEWCRVNFDGEADAFTPTWLPYWLSLAIEIKSNIPSLAPPETAPPEMVARAAKLEKFVSLMQAEPSLKKYLPETTPQIEDDRIYIDCITNLIEKNNRLIYSEVIIHAIRIAENPRSSASVWVALCQIVKRGGAKGILEFIDNRNLRVVGSASPRTLYTITTLDQYLYRYKKKITPQASICRFDFKQ